MIRFGRLNLALALLLVLPTIAAAQKDSKQTKEASKFLGLAMAKQNPEERTKLYEQAMVHLREGMQVDAQNAKVWMLSGTVLAALGQMAEADEAFKRAQQMHAPYAADIETERESAWIAAFNAGIEKMEAKDYPAAIKIMEDAQVIYSLRPEALMNLGALYASQNEMAKAEKAFNDAIEATKGPLFAKQDEEGQAAWLRFREMATLNLAQMAGARGVDAFEKQDYQTAAKEFATASEINPMARDYWFNQMQAYWAQASGLQEKLDSMPAAQQPAAKQELIKLYEQVLKFSQKTRELDPNSEVLYIIEAQSERRTGEATGGADKTKQGQDKALALLETAEALPVILSDIMVQAEEGGVAITGNLMGKKLAAGSAVTLHFTLVSLDGKVLGEQDVNVTVGAADTDVPFTAKVGPITGEVAGWKYTVKN